MSDRNRRRPRFDDGFGGEAVTEAIARVRDAGWQGASNIGVMGQDTEPFPAPKPRKLRATPRPQQERLSADTDPAPVYATVIRGWAHLDAITCRCGAEHRDPAAGTFTRLRMSAQTAGWHLDALGHWTCETCQMNPHYRTLYPLAIWDPDAIEARLRHDPAGERQAVAAAELDAQERMHAHYDASHRRGRHAQEMTA